MNDLPRQQLCKLIATYGRSLCDEPRRCEALLRDVCSQYRREISVLVGALKEGVAADLLASQNSVPHEVLLARLTRRLHDNLALAEDAARWAVESWALALGVISSAECQPSQPEPESPPRRATPARKPETQPADSSQSPYPSAPPSVSPQYRQDNIFQAKPPTPSPVVPTPKGSTQLQLSVPTRPNSVKSAIKAIEYAGFMQRFAAAVIDSIILQIAYSIMAGIIFGGVTINFLLLILYWLYYSLMESSSKQATLGKMALGIFVTDLNGNRISFGKATARYFSKIISGLILGIGFLMAGFTKKKQALHDIVADCLVLKKK